MGWTRAHILSEMPYESSASLDPIVLICTPGCGGGGREGPSHPHTLHRLSSSVDNGIPMKTYKAQMMTFSADLSASNTGNGSMSAIVIMERVHFSRAQI